ncbi:HesB/IscA family protein [Roseomonas marmotae]|uniref:Iron-sulfur cluster assembly accessory protein n=1 Tax=Roseomonas marmotae TaxID=2768161 RepID=A0ABS3KCR4_9PROT|nr:iron-sulfur cluster assembly accessory protein [Roseomonas marmotae]MBO1075263.1 iron-sulfur cluster assembly accessory protein [Roseomonas marmotae]QTI78248.1 iron-sulfur cluster assembly accessory protein [Roseomonas marmotae]
MPDGTISPPTFQVTPRAFAQVAEISAREGRPGAGLRVAVQAGGCSGFQYSFGMEDAPADDDLVLEGPAARVFIDPVSLDLLAGAQLDWTDELIGAHFAISNPQAVSGCGCGASFSIG